MSRDFERQRQFTRRAVILGLGQAALTTVLLGRLYFLQIAEKEKYEVLSEENRISLRLIIPPRGVIKDRYGIPLAENRRNFRLQLIPEKVGSNNDTLTSLAKFLQLSDGELARIRSDIDKRKAFAPILIHNNLDWEQVAELELNNLDLPGANIEVGQTRHYPFEDVTAHVLGYVAPISETELSKNVYGDDPLVRSPELRVGKKGIEKNYESLLRGSAGSSQLEVNAYGRIIRELETDDGKPGTSLTMTLDIELQKMAMQLMHGQSGSAVVMNADSGEILVLASAPGFDPNKFNNGISVKDWEDLLSNAYTPLLNKAVSGLYAPGSTFKAVTALAALDSGLVDPNYHVYCDGQIDLGNAKFHCWKKGGHGTLDLTGAIRESCDVYFYDVAQKLGIDRIAETARGVGLGAATGIDIPGEKNGLIPDRRWKSQRFKAGWHKGETLVAGIGQGYILTTPLQLATMTAHIVNGGRRITPHLLLGDPNKDDGVDEATDSAKGEGDVADNSKGIKFSKKHLQFVVEAMNQVVNAPNGTAHGARISTPGMEMGGKTGTAQVRRISMAERATGVIKNENLPWKERDHALFIGFAPVDKPKYVAAVVIEHGGGGSAVAAPIARDLLREAQKRDPELAAKAAAIAKPA